MKRVLGVLVALTVGLGAPVADACQPCESKLDLEITARLASLVVVARRVGEALERPDDDLAASFAQFEVEKVLKGTPIARRIDVALGWWCGFGPEVPIGESAVLFLEPKGNRYFTIRDGCSVRSLPVLDGKVVVNNTPLPMEVVTMHLGPSPGAPAAPIQEPPWRRWAIPALLCLATGLLGFAIGRRRRR